MKFDYYNNPVPMPDCMYPAEYHNMYGYMYHWMDPEVRGDMVCPYMYPDIYYKIYPYVCKICEKMDNLDIPYLPQSYVEKMIDECYDMCVREMPELEEYAGGKAGERKNEKSGSGVTAYRRPILRDLIAIILLAELFRRRRRRFFPYWRRYGGYYGY